MQVSESISGSFRDPSGIVFRREGVIYRQVNMSYGESYDRLIESGLYAALVAEGLLIPHDEVGPHHAISDDAYKVIRPEPIQFISYPYEWSFSQLKAAALTTLHIQETALNFGMSLRDSSAYNIQFRNGRPVLIDTLSFERCREGQPWIAYRQFCQHFLAPLALMSCRDARLSQLLRVFVDGIPLDLASELLPFRSWLKFPLLCHIHLHAKGQKRFADKAVDRSGARMSGAALRGLIYSLEAGVRKLRWKPGGTQWADYYDFAGYSSEALEHKKSIVSQFLDRLGPGTVWDLGANIGVFSRIASDKGMQTVAFDNDPSAVEKSYLGCVREGRTNLLPLLLDLTNPSPSIGWENEERMSLLQRGPANIVLALALIHHIAISNNVPLGKIAEFFSRICRSLIVEFVPKSDSRVQKLLSTREDIFSDYTREVFQSEFSKRFQIHDSVDIKDSERTLYLMTRRETQA
jgi:hypothetical protein